MQHKKTYSVPATTKEIIDRVTCDLCGEEIRRKDYHTDEVKISRRVGTCYPDVGEGEAVEVDCCGECFESKVLAWLKTQGVEPRREPYDY